jgi:UPF0755 protein
MGILLRQTGLAGISPHAASNGSIKSKRQHSRIPVSRRRRKNRLVRRLFLLVVLLGVLAAVYLLAMPYGPSRQTFVEIAPGTSSRQIAKELEQQGIIRSRYTFDLWRTVEGLRGGGTLKAGEYLFDHPARVSEVYSRLRRGDAFTIEVTFPEGSNIFDIAARVEAAQLGTAQSFVQVALNDGKLVADLDPQATSLEGYLFPDTYHLGRHATPEQMAAAMVKRFRQEAASLGLHGGAQGDVHRVTTVASLIERETPIDAERPLVASVFSNRLARNMPLMTDPSVIYAAMLQGRYRGTIYQSDLDSDSPYNTYKRVGLPPGPICNPGAASLQAALHPAATNYLYFVAASANPSGHSRFAATLEEHQKNVQQYRSAVRGSGGR